MRKMMPLSTRTAGGLLCLFAFTLSTLILATILHFLLHVEIDSQRNWGNILFGGLWIGFIGIAVFFFQAVFIPYKKIKRIFNNFNKGFVFDDLFNCPEQLTPELQWVLGKLQQMLDQKDALKLAISQSQYMALQNQINPHFLYNTLDAIRGDALMAGLDDIAKTTEALSTFFAYNISNLDKYATLEDELENVSDYFTIQQYRFGSKLKLVIINHDESSLLDCTLPKMTLQPIVENAIYHGLECKSKMGTVAIHCQRFQTQLVINIIDDGVGMPENEVDKLNGRLNRADYGYENNRSNRRGGIALVNVNSRIKLLFGDAYGLSVMSVPDLGTDVRIILPLVVGDSNHEK
jgi:two-component system sensor histidine kinase YesM